MKTILLKYEKKKCLIWEGSNRTIENINQEPLVLEFDEEKFYFYVTNLKLYKGSWKKDWINFKTQLDFFNQLKIIHNLSKVDNDKNLEVNNILLYLKYKVFENVYKTLNKKFIKTKKIFQEQKDQNKDIKKKINTLSKNLWNFKLKFKILRKNIILLNTENEIIIIKNKIIQYSQELDFLSTKWLGISENFKILTNILQDNEQYNKIEKQLSENLFNERSKKIRLYNQNNKVIFLNYHKNKSVVWIGTNETPETMNREILALTFDNQKFYFYPEKIVTFNYNKSNKWINFKNQLSFDNQEKIINEFSKIFHKTNLYNQSLYFKLKCKTLLNESKILNLNLEKIKLNMNYQQQEEQQIVIKEIIMLINYHKKLEKEIIIIDKKIKSFNRKNNYEILDTVINKEIINQEISEINNNEENIISINDSNSILLKIQNENKKISNLNIKVNTLIKNFDLFTQIIGRLNQYKKILLNTTENSNNETFLFETIWIKPEDQNLEENEDNTNELNTSFDSLNNQTIIKQESPENLTDDILIESEIEFNDHIKSEIIKQETQDNTDKPSTSFNSSNETIIDNLVDDYQPLLKKIKIEQSDSSDELDYLNY